MTATLKDKISEMEKESIVDALEKCSWVKARAARQLGITERMIGYKIKKYGIGIKEMNEGEAKISDSDNSNNHHSIFKRRI